MAQPCTDQSAQITAAHWLPLCFSVVPGSRVNEFLEPGNLVRHPEQPDWGLGQVQSVIGDRLTVNFEHVGKIVIDGSRVELVLVFGTSAG